MFILLSENKTESLHRQENWRLFPTSMYLVITMYVMFLNIYNKLLWASGEYLEKLNS